MRRRRGIRPAWVASAALGLSLVATCWASPRSVNYSKVKVAGTPTHVVTVNLNDPEVRVSVAMARSAGGAETFRSVLRRTRPAAAITGTYFATDSFWPVGDIVVDGQWLNHGLVGTALAITADNHAEFIETRHHPDRDWSAYTTVLCGGPRLLTDGKVTVGPRWEGFRDRSLLALRPRTAVGLTKWGKLLMVAVTKPIHLTRLAGIMRRLGAWDAINLDGGSSTAMFYRGALFSRPARSLTNLLVVYDTREAFARKRPGLAPGRLAAATPALEELPCERLDLLPR
jgi:exopolysaccharide biosynthesis protein